jgi:glutaminyl-tRNA synthetase
MKTPSRDPGAPPASSGRPSSTASATVEPTGRSEGRDFIRQIIDRDNEEGKYGGRVITRFPPEPNGYLHIGHAKSILLNFGIAKEYGGRCHLRFDDTNPATEEAEYVRAIKEDVAWLGFDWGEHLYHAADYFDRMYDYAESLIRDGLAYVDSQPEEAIRENRGTVTEPGVASPDRSRTVEENLNLFRRMRAGEFSDGEYVLRAKIDLGSANMLMRDPILYRIRHAPHHRSGDAWCIYPLYDYAHCLEDAIEDVTHSLCTLEFANNRELYDWILDHVGIEEPRPHQYEFGKGLLDYTITSKRKLLRLVQEGRVSGWDDPRMPTLAAFRRRGVPSEAILQFWTMVGVARADARIDIGKLEYTVRDVLNSVAPRVFAVLDPLRVSLIGWPEGQVVEVDAEHFPPDVPGEGSRTLRLTGELFIERDDFSLDPPPGYKRLVPGGEVRLRHGCVIRCEEVVAGPAGEVLSLRCSYDPTTWRGVVPDGRKIKGTVHWLSAADAVPCEVRLYDRLFSVPDPEAAAAERGEGVEFTEFLNPKSLRVVERALVEPSVFEAPRDTRFQFERLGYFWRDPLDDRPGRPVFSRIVTLRDTWARVRDVAEPSGRVRAEPNGKRAAARPASEVKPRADLPPEARARAEALRERHRLSEVDSEILARDAARTRFLEEALAAYPDDAPKADLGVALANWLINDVSRVQGERELDELPFGPRELARLVALVATGQVSRRAAGEILDVIARDGGDPRDVVQRLNLAQVSDTDALAPIVREVVAAFPGKVKEFKSGREGLLGFFMGQVMSRTGGKADPEVAKRLLRDELARE